MICQYNLSVSASEDIPERSREPVKISQQEKYSQSAYSSIKHTLTVNLFQQEKCSQSSYSNMKNTASQDNSSIKHTHIHSQSTYSSRENTVSQNIPVRNILPVKYSSKKHAARKDSLVRKYSQSRHSSIKHTVSQNIPVRNT
jgi:hypothetical protein